MIQQVQFCDIPVEFSVEGSGDPLLFLHGYLESKEIWKGFADRFCDQYKVICMDIPGHGRSGVLSDIHSMEMIADAAVHVLESEGIHNGVTVFGHSMGGYAAMELVSKYPEMIRGYCLFHSTCFADNEEKRLNREREISLVKCGKKIQIVRTNIPKGFSEVHLETFENEIERCKEIAASTSDEGIIALLRGMQERKDHSATLASEQIHPMIIWGKQDNYIGEEPFAKMIGLAPHATVLILKESGHMGFIEEADCAFSGIRGFLDGLK